MNTSRLQGAGIIIRALLRRLVFIYLYFRGLEDESDPANEEEQAYKPAPELLEEVASRWPLETRARK